MRPRAVGHVRVSSEEQAEEGVSIEAQTATLVAYAVALGLELVVSPEVAALGKKVGEDAGVSAKDLERPALARALGMIRRGEAEGLLVTKLDRPSRSVADCNKRIVGYFGEKAGKPLWSVGDSIDIRTAAGQLVLNVLTSVAQWEREAITERSREALQHKVRTHSRCGVLRYGHEIDPADPRVSKKTKRPVGLVENAEGQATLVLIQRRREEGRSLREIASALTRRGVPTKQGGAGWSHSSIDRPLRRTPNRPKAG